MLLKYRKPEDAVSDTSRRNRYGYFERLEYIHPKRLDVLKMGTAPTVAAQGGEWPILLQVQFPVHNHEDLQLAVDRIIEVFDSLRGEHGENEKTSPSEFRVIKP